MKLTNLLNYSRTLLFLSIIIALQSCNVYHSQSYSIDKAIEKEKKIKVLTKDLQTYEFDYITKSGDSLIGHAKTKSNTAKLLQANKLTTSENGKISSFYIDSSQVQEIKVKNGAASTSSKIGAGLGIVGIVAGVGLAIIILTAF